MQSITFISLALALLPGTLTAQQDVVAAGGDGSSSEGSISYSIGQVVYTNEISAEGTINHGVQQPYSVTPIFVEEPLKLIDVSLFPNPTRDYVLISMPEFRPGITISVFDVQGDLLEEKSMQSAQTLLFVHEWSAAHYIIRLCNQSRNCAEYKLIKL
jgi:hypothetical protein